MHQIRFLVSVSLSLCLCFRRSLTLGYTRLTPPRPFVRSGWVTSTLYGTNIESGHVDVERGTGWSLTCLTSCARGKVTFRWERERAYSAILVNGTPYAQARPSRRQVATNINSRTCMRENQCSAPTIDPLRYRCDRFNYSTPPKNATSSRTFAALTYR